nr:MAG TPA: hypothetical protein [Caudoviricetes sp.]
MWHTRLSVLVSVLFLQVKTCGEKRINHPLPAIKRVMALTPVWVCTGYRKGRVKPSLNRKLP